MTGYDLTLKMRKARRKYPLTATEQALFYELVAICNEVDWEDVFSCSNEELCNALNISENTLNVSRMALINAHLLHYASGKSKRQYGKYSFTKKLTTSKFDTKTGANPGTNSSTNPGVNPGTNGQKTTSKNEDNNKPVIVLNQTETKPIESFAAGAAVDENKDELKVDPEERKKSSAQKKKEDATPHWSALVSEWFRFYVQMHGGAKPSFEEVKGSPSSPPSNLKQLMQKIRQRVADHPATANVVWDEGNAVTYLRMYLTKAWNDQWLRDNFLLSNLNSKFDAIANRKEQSNSKNGRAAPANENLTGELVEYYANLAGQG